jgi:hypothetical protein
MFFPQDVFTIFLGGGLWFLEISVHLPIFITKLTVSYERTLSDFVSASADLPSGQKQFICPARPSEMW